MKIKVETVKRGDCIMQDTMLVSENERLRTTMSKTIVDTQDKQVQEMLISLGWTPPKDKR